MKRILTLVLAVLSCVSAFGQFGSTSPAGSLSTESKESFVAGRFIANAYSFVPNQSVIATGNAVAASSTITVRGGYIVLLDGRALVPYAVGVPLVINDASPELITPTAVSGCYDSAGANQDGITVTCTITAVFAALHGTGAGIISATAGAAEAALDASNRGGGIVVLSPGWAGKINTTCTGCYATKTAALQAILPYSNVSFEDDSVAPPVYWNTTPAATTILAVPTTLTSSTAFSSLTVAGSASYTGGTIHVCIAYVDVMGNEGPCSADYSFADTSAKAIQFTAPAASPGAVGWIPYIGLESGSSGNEYQVALVTQPTVIGVYPLAVSGLCPLTIIETITPACPLTNATYGQTGVGAVVAAYPVVTSPQAVGLGGQDGSAPTSYYEGNSNSRTVYQYQPGGSVGVAGLVKASGAFHITTAAASTVPQIMGTLSLPVGFMNYVGREIEICGYAYSSTQGATTTVMKVLFEWDAQGSDVTTGLPVIIGGPFAVGSMTTGTTAQFDFCQDFTTTVASASATGGSIRAGHGYLIECALTTCATPFSGPNMTVAAVGSLNLAEQARIHVVMVQTGSSTAVPALINLSVRVLN